MSLDGPSLQELAAAAPAPEGVEPAVAVIAGTAVRTLDHALMMTSIGTKQAELELEIAEEEYGIAAASESRMQANSDAIKDRTAARLQEIIQEMHERGQVPSAEMLDDLMRLQEEGTTVMDMTGPSDDDTAETDRSELEQKRLEAQWQQQDLQERIEEARANRDAALERTQFIDLARQIKATRHKFSYPVRYASILLCSIVIGAGAAGLVYKAETMSNQGAAEITRETNHEYPDQRQPIPSLALDDDQRLAIGASGSFGLFLGGLGGMWLGEGLSGPTARWRARRAVRKAEAAAESE